MSTLFGRRASLWLTSGTQVLDLSEMQFQFHTHAPDMGSPWHAEIRVFNLSQATVNQIRGEFSGVTVQAGYGDQGAYGVVFDGTVKQYRIGRDNATDTFLEIFATDGDMAHNYGVIATTLAGGNDNAARAKALNDSFTKYGAPMESDKPLPTGGILPRGKVMFGMTRDYMNDACASTGQTWFIEHGRVVTVPLTGYRAGDAIVLTSATGLLGRPEQTNGGVLATCLLNPNIRTGTLVRIDNSSINQIAVAKGNPFNAPYDQWIAAQPPNTDPTVKGFDSQMLAKLAADGVYKVLVAEHHGDTRGQDWCTDITCIALNQVTDTVNPYAG